ncbi:MAG: transporter [Planctomycetaceae bacterium]
MRRNAVAIALALAVGGGVAAADGEWELGTDRDAFTPCTHSVAPGTILQEASEVYIDNQTGLPTNNYPEWIVRVGATERFEWRFGVNYGAGSQGNVVTSVEVGEGTYDGRRLYESSLLYGFKLDATEQDGWMPESCLIMEGTTPTSGDVLGTVPVATIVAGWELAAGWRLDGAIRYAYSEGLEGWFSRWSPSVVLRMPVTERFEVHAEWFGSFTQGLVDDASQPFFSPGMHVMVTRRLELGVRIGWGLTAEAAPFFSDAGLGWRW